MTLEEQFNFLNFWINKNTGSYYTVQELTDLLHVGSLAVFNDYVPRASTSQRIKDALSPFKDTYEFSPSDTLNGIITVPADRKYQHLLDIEIRYAISGRSLTKYVPLSSVNEDERSERLNSQIDPVTVTSPILEQMGIGEWQLYPKSQYFGKVSFYREPTKPVYGYTLISGRVIVYNANTSTQLDWKTPQHNECLMKALASIGINLNAAELLQWAEAKNSQNFLNQNHS